MHQTFSVTIQYKVIQNKNENPLIFCRDHNKRILFRSFIKVEFNVFQSHFLN